MKDIFITDKDDSDESIDFNNILNSYKKDIKIFKNIPKCITDLIGEANKFFINKDFDTVINLCFQIITYNPDNIEAYHLLYLVYEEQGNFKKSLDFLFLKYQLSKEKDYLNWMSLGNKYLELNELTSASYCYSRSINLDKNNLILWNKKCFCYEKMNNIQGMIKYYYKIINLNNSDIEIIFKLTNLLYKINQKYEIIELIVNYFINNQEESINFQLLNYILEILLEFKLYNLITPIIFDLFNDNFHLEKLLNNFLLNVKNKNNSYPKVYLLNKNLSLWNKIIIDLPIDILINLLISLKELDLHKNYLYENSLINLMEKNNFEFNEVNEKIIEFLIKKNNLNDLKSFLKNFNMDNYNKSLTILKFYLNNNEINNYIKLGKKLIKKFNNHNKNIQIKLNISKFLKEKGNNKNALNILEEKDEDKIFHSDNSNEEGEEEMNKFINKSNLIEENSISPEIFFKEIVNKIINKTNHYITEDKLKLKYEQVIINKEINNFEKMSWYFIDLIKLLKEIATNKLYLRNKIKEMLNKYDNDFLFKQLTFEDKKLLNKNIYIYKRTKINKPNWKINRILKNYKIKKLRKNIIKLFENKIKNPFEIIDVIDFKKILNKIIIYLEKINNTDDIIYILTSILFNFDNIFNNKEIFELFTKVIYLLFSKKQFSNCFKLLIKFTKYNKILIENNNFYVILNYLISYITESNIIPNNNIFKYLRKIKNDKNENFVNHIKANLYFINNSYKLALNEFMKLYKNDTNIINLNLKIILCNLFLSVNRNQYNKEEYFQDMLDFIKKIKNEEIDEVILYYNIGRIFLFNKIFHISEMFFYKVLKNIEPNKTYPPFKNEIKLKTNINKEKKNDIKIKSAYNLLMIYKTNKDQQMMNYIIENFLTFS